MLELESPGGYACEENFQDTVSYVPPGGLEPRSCDESVRLLAVYTDRGASRVGNIEATIRLAVSSMQTALTQSGVSASDLKLELVAIERIAYTSDLNDFQRTLDDLTLSGEVDGLREDHDADIVVALVGNVRELNGQITYGLAWNLPVLDPERHVAIVRSDRATVNWGAAHEIAHLFGCGHENGRDARPSARAKEFKISGWYRLFNRRHRTIMWSNGDANNLVSHYSNPLIEYRGAATGDNDRNNAQQLIDAACVVADHRPYDPPAIPFIVEIEGETTTCACQPTVLGADVSGSSSSGLTYEWAISANGFVYSDPISTNSSVAIWNDCIVQSYFVRLIVTNQLGESRTKIVRVQAVDRKDGMQCNLYKVGAGINDNESQEAVRYSLEVGQSGHNEWWTVSRSRVIIQDQVAQVEVFDLLGRRIFGMPITFEGSNQVARINVSNIAASLFDGVYMVRMSSRGQVSSTIVNLTR